jgi:hydroxymethylpyrimidine pyrophosphatase-like HAD family hydrolase
MFGMSRFFRAVAVDYDGTLTERRSPEPGVLAALAEARRGGFTLVLVTGRRLAHLQTDFPGFHRAFDAVVAENGAVLWHPSAGARTVAQPVPPELDAPLAALGIPFIRGEVLLATEARFDQVILGEVARLGLEVQLVRNREALMVLPPGVSKGTGLLEALRDLGISPHATIGVGDAENDHSLVETCELGVAVSNAVPGLQAHADVVLAHPAGEGVVSLLRGPLMQGRIRVQPKRWRARLGTLAGGGLATVPGSQVNLLVVGGSRTGKSCLAGLLTERLAAMGYVLCVLDPEGDHVGLEGLRGMLVSGGKDMPPDEEHLTRLLRLGSVILDLSLHPLEERVGGCCRLLALLAGIRERTGLPHWIVFDEAHLVPEAGRLLHLADEPSAAGVCLATYRPGDLAVETVQAMDLAVALPGAGASEIEGWLEASGFPGAGLAQVPLPREGEADRQALLLDRREARRFTIDRRARAHVRHWHKYHSGELPAHRRFFFRRGERLTGAVAGSIGEFHDEVARAEPEVVAHHARNHDFSRWIAGVIGDGELAGEVRSAEREIARSVDGLEENRLALLHAIEARYTEG